MSRSKVDDLCVEEQKKKAAAAKRAAKRAANKAAKSGNATGNAKPEGQEQGIPVDLGDYKGARKKLRHDVKAVVKGNSALIAVQLVSKAKAGDMRGTKMMLSLIEKKKQGADGKKKKKKRSGPSWAQLLVSEPEWDESMEESKEQKAS